MAEEIKFIPAGRSFAAHRRLAAVIVGIRKPYPCPGAENQAFMERMGHVPGSANLPADR